MTSFASRTSPRSSPVGCAHISSASPFCTKSLRRTELLRRVKLRYAAGSRGSCTMLLLVLPLLLTAEPRYLGGAAPTPLRQPGPVDQRPTLDACSTQTLRKSSQCVFDSHPHKSDSEAAKKKQSK